MLDVFTCADRLCNSHMLFYHAIMVLQSNIFLSNSSLTIRVVGQNCTGPNSERVLGVAS